MLALTKGYQQTREEAVRCWGGGGAMAVVMGWLGVACAINGDGGTAGARRLRLRVLRTAKEEWESETEGADGGGWVLA